MNNNILEFFVKMKDLMSSGLAKLATTSKQKFSEIQNYINQTVASNKKLGDSFDNVEKKVRSSSSAMPGYIKNLTAAVGLMAVVGFGKGTVNSAMAFEAKKVSFGVLAGNKETGLGLANRLNKLQQDTILGPEVFAAAQTMMGFGIAAKDVEPAIKHLGDIAMGDADRFSALTLAFSQTSAAGRLMGQDLLQYVNAGFNPLQTISAHWKEFGFTSKKTIGQLKDLMQDGKISAEMVSKALEIATGKGGMFNDMMNVIGETSFGKMKKLEGQWEALKIKIGETLMPYAIKLMKFFEQTMNWIEKNITAIEFWAKTIAEVWIAFKVLSGVQAILTSISVAAAAAGGSIGGAMMAALGPVGILTAAVGGLLYMLNDCAAAQENLQRIQQNGLNTVYKQEQDSITGMIKSLKEKNKLSDEDATKRILNAETGSILSSIQDNYTKIKDAQAEYNSRKGVLKIRAGEKLDELNRVANNLAAQKKAVDEYKPSSASAANIKGGGGSGAGIAGTGTGKDVAHGITGGGPRVINISIGKMVEKIEVHAQSAADGYHDVERKVQEVFLRVLNSGAAVQ